MPTNLSYLPQSTGVSSLVSPSLWFNSIYVSIDLHPNIPDSLRRSSTYFCCDTNIPSFDRATSIPRKYLSFPSYYISNTLANWSLSNCISIGSLPVTIISSTYTINVVTLLEVECYMYNMWSPWLCLYFIFNITLVNLPNYALGNCFNPYEAFFYLQTLFMSNHWSKLDGASIYTSFSKSPCKNAFFTSNCCKHQSKLAANDKSTCRVLFLP